MAYTGQGYGTSGTPDGALQHLVALKGVYSDEQCKQMESVVMDAFEDDPRIQKKTNISVAVKSKGSSDTCKVHLIGKVGSESEKKAAEEIVDHLSEKSVEIVNELVVDQESAGLL